MEAFQRIAWASAPVLRFLLGGLFIYAGVAKLLDVSAFVAQLQRFGVGNPTLSTFAAHYLPFLEIACGVALVARRCTLGATTLCLSLLIVFEIGLLYAWVSGVRADCGCFGAFFGGASIQAAFVRNLGLLAIGAAVLAREWTLGRRSLS